ncbi:MAG: hypothetical protein AB4063_10330 [Crocosphaera sp.]
MAFTTIINSLEEFLKLPETKPLCEYIDFLSSIVKFSCTGARYQFKLKQ